MSSTNSTETISSTFFLQSPCVRTMAAGKCWWAGTKGPCGDCEEPRFKVGPDGIVIDECDDCGHALKYHENFPSGVPSVPGAPSVPLANHDSPHEVITDRTCPRKDTVRKLMQLSDNFPIIHIRGTPATGKTILAHLLRKAFMQQGTPVFFFSGWKPLVVKDEDSPTVWAALRARLAERDPQASLGKSVLIVDEAQATYRDDKFWNIIIKESSAPPGPPEPVRIYLFCCFGSPKHGVDNVIYSPHKLVSGQRVTLTPQSGYNSPTIGLFYTENEFDEAVSEIQRNCVERFQLTDDGKKYLRRLTNGHPGCLQAMMECIYAKYRSDMKHQLGFEVTESKVIEFMSDESSAFEKLQNSTVSRCFISDEERLEPDEASILCEIAENGRVPWDLKRAGMAKCYYKGWIHRLVLGRDQQFNRRVKEIAVFPSMLNERHVKHLIGDENNFLPSRFTTLPQLCIEILRRFSAANLRNSTSGKMISVAGCPRPVEAQYQDEFYAKFNTVVGRGVPICTEWSRKSPGRVDFLLPEKKWAIEFLRDYDRLEAHLSRFKEGGQYYAWIEEEAVSDWIVINCTTTWPTHEHDEPRLFHAVFENDFTELRLFDHKGRLLLGSLSGT